MEDSYETNKEALGGISPGEYAKLYSNTMGNEIWESKRGNRVAQAKDPDYAALDANLEANKDTWVNMGKIMNTSPEAYGFSKNTAFEYTIPDFYKNKNGKIGQARTSQGKLINTMNLEKTAATKRYYFRPNEMNPQNQWGPLEDYEMASAKGTPFRTDENGKEFMLVMDYNTRTWNEVPADSVVAGNTARSKWGVQQEDSGVLEHAWDMAANTITDMFITQWGTAAEVAGTFSNWITGDNDINSWQKWGRQVQNYGNASKSKISEAAENESMFSSVRGFAGVASSAITQAGAQLLLGNVMGTAGAAFSTAGKLGGYAQKIVSGAPWAFGALYAGNAMNEEAKSAGINDDDRMALTLGAMATVFAAELTAAKFLGASGIADGFKSKGSQKLLGENMAKSFNKLIAESGEALVTPTATTVAKEAAKKTIFGGIRKGMSTVAGKGSSVAGKALNFVQTIARAPIKFGYSEAPTSFLGRFKGAVASGWEEGWEESMEGMLNSFMKDFYNKGYIGWEGPGDYAEPGKGKFQNTKWDHKLEEFVGGFLGGSFTGAVMGGRLKRNFTDHNIAEMALQYNTFDEADRELAKLHSKGAFDRSDITQNDQFLSMLPDSEKDSARSRNDIAYEALREQLRTAFQIKDTLGLGDAKLINKVMGGDMKLVKDTLVNVMDSKKIEKEIAKDKALLTESEKDSETEKAIQARINENENKYKTLKTLSDKALSGEMIDEYKAHMVARELLANKAKKAQMIMLTFEQDDEKKKQMAEGIMEEAINAAEKKDLWKDQVKAIKVVGQIRELDKKYKEQKAIIEAEKKASKEIFDTTVFPADIEDDVQFNKFIEELTGKTIYDSDFADQLNAISDTINKRKAELDDEILAEMDTNPEHTVDEYLDPEMKFLNDIDADKKDEAVKRLESLKVKDALDERKNLTEKQEKINGRKSTMKTTKDTNFVKLGHLEAEGDIKKRTALDAFIDDVTPEAVYFAKEKGTTSDISEEDYEKAKKASGTKEDNFEYDGVQYQKVAEDNITKVKGQRKEGGVTIADEIGTRFSSVDSAMRAVIEEDEGDAKELYRILENFKQTGSLTDADKAFLKSYGEKLDEKDQMFELMSFSEQLEQNGVLTEAQKKYFSLPEMKALGKNLDAYKLRHESNRTRYQDVKADTISKEEREDNLKKLRKSTFRIFGAVHNALVGSGMDMPSVTVEGVTFDSPNMLLPTASEDTVVKAMQYWHYLFKSMDPKDHAKFFNQFKLFWHSHIQRMTNDGTDLKIEKRDGDYTFYSAEEQGMFLDSFDSMLDDQVMMEEGYKYGLDKNNHYREIMFYNTINMMFNMDMGVFYDNMLDVFDKVDDVNKFDLKTASYGGDHTFEQILNLMFGAAHLHEGQNRESFTPEKIALLDQVKTVMKIGSIPGAKEKSSALYPSLSDDAGELVYDASHIRDNYMLFTGSGGVGKTSYFVKTIVEYATLIGKKKFVLVAPNADQLEGLKKSIPAWMLKDKSYDISFYIIEDFLPIQHELENAVIVSDEVSLLNTNERNTLYFQGKLSKDIDGNDIKVSDSVKGEIHSSNTVFILGDQSQAPYSIDEDENSPKMSTWMQHGLNMTQVKRTDSIDIFNIQNKFRLNALSPQAKVPVLDGFQYSNDGGVKRGVNLNSDETSFKSEAIAAVTAGKGWIIVNNEDQYNAIVAEIPADKHDRVFYMTNKKKSPQGRTLDGEVYVYMPATSTMASNPKMTPMYYNRYMLTAVGRASTYVSVYTGDGLGSRNSTLVENDKLATFNDNEKERIVRKKELYDSFKEVNDKLPKVGPSKKTVPKKPALITGTIPTGGTPPVGGTPETKKEEKEKAETGTGTGNGTGYGKGSGRSGSRKKKEFTNKKKGTAVTDTTPEAKKEEEKKEKIYNAPEVVTSTVKDDDLPEVSGGKGSKQVDARVVFSINDGEGIQTFVTSSGFIVQVNATYKSGDTKVKVKQINKVDGKEEYQIVFDIIKEDINYKSSSEKLTLQLFENKFGKSIDQSETKQNAMTTLAINKKLTFFGRVMSTDIITATKNEDQRAQYRENIAKIAKTVQGLNGIFSVKVKVRKGVTTVDWKGERRTATYLLEVFTEDDKYLGAMQINPIGTVKTDKDAYEQHLYNILESKSAAQGNEFYLMDKPVIMRKESILQSSFLATTGEGKTKMGFPELQALASSLGMTISVPFQDKAESFDGDKPMSGVESFVYISTSKNPTKDNSLKVIVRSKPFNDMNENEITKFLNVMDSIITSTNGLKLDNDQDIMKVLAAVGTFIDFNRSSILTNFPGLITMFEKGSLAEKAKARLKFLKDAHNSLLTSDKYGFLRMPALVDVTNKQIAHGSEILQTDALVYPTPPTLFIEASQLFGIEGVEENMLFDLVEDKKELDAYDMAAEQLKATMVDILGEGIDLGFFTSENVHGFVNKTGGIFLNFRNGLGNSKTLYHEIAHYVSEFLLTTDAQDKLFSEVAKKYGIKNWKTDETARRAVAEKLAEGAERYTSDRRNLKGISKYLQQFFDVLSRFMSKMGLIKSTIRDFYYDVYIAKKFKSNLGQALSVAREEMALDTLYSKSDRVVPFTVVEDHFYSKDVARAATRTVATVIAQEVVAPTMNSRLFKDNTVSFSDMINRVEFSARSKVMFEIDERGNVITEKFTYDGQEFDRPVVRNLEIKDSSGKAVPLFKWETDPRDAKGNIKGGLQLMYFDTETQKYVDSPLSEKGIFFLDSYVRNKVRKLLRQALQNYTVKTSHGDVSIMDKTEEGQLKLATILDAKDKALYQAAMTLHDEVLYGMINRYFPTIDVAKSFKDNRHVSFDDIAESLNRIQDANIRKDSQETNHMDNQSDIMKLILATTPMYMFHSDYDKYLPTGAFIDQVMANTLMAEVDLLFWNPTPDENGNPLSSIDSFANALLKKIEISENYKGGKMIAMMDREHAALKSMYEQFFALSDKVPGLNFVSHRQILKWRDRLAVSRKNAAEFARELEIVYNHYVAVFETQKKAHMLGSNDKPLEKGDFAKYINTRAYHSEMVLNSLVTHFGSVAKNKFNKSIIYGTEANANFYHREVQTGNTQEQMNMLEDHLNNIMYANDGTVSERYKDLFAFNGTEKTPATAYRPIVTEGDKLPGLFYPTSDGIMYFASGRKNMSDKGVVVFPIVDGNIAPVRMNEIIAYASLISNELGKTVTIETIIRDTFTDFFNKSDIARYHGLIKRLSSPKVGKDKYGIEDLHKMLTPMLMSMYVHAAERTYSDSLSENAPQYEQYKAVLDKYATESNHGKNYGKVTDGARTQRMDQENKGTIIDQGEDEDYYYFPTGFFEELEKLASMMAVGNFNPTVPSLQRQRKIYTTGVQDTMGYKLLGGNDRLVDVYAANMELSKTTEGYSHSNHNSRGGLVLNPMLGNKGFVKEISYEMGLQGQSSAAELDQMTINDNFNSSITAFTKGLKSSPETFAANPAIIPFYNQAQRGRQRSAAVKFDMKRIKVVGSNGLLILDNAGNVTLDNTNIMLHINKSFMMREEAQVNSLNRWIKFLVKKDKMKDEGLINTTTFGWKEKRDAVYFAINEYVNISNFNVMDDEVHMLTDNGLVSGVDYIVIKSSKKDRGGRVQLGYDTTMMNDVKTRQLDENKEGTGFHFRKTPASVFNYTNYNKEIPVEVLDTNKNPMLIKYKLHEILSNYNEATDSFFVNAIDSKGRKIVQSLTEGDYGMLIDMLFNADFAEVNRIAIKENYELHPGKIPGYSEKETRSILGISTGKEKTANGKEKYKYLPAWKAMIIGHHFLNSYYQNGLEGTEALEMSNILYEGDGGPIQYGQNNNKRMLMWSSTGMGVSQGTYNGIDPQTRVMVLKDLRIAASIDTINGSVQTEKHITFDGQSFTNPFYLLMYYNSTGGNRGSANMSGGTKTVAPMTNFITGRETKKKHAGNTFTKQSMAMSDDETALFRLMLNPRSLPVKEDASAALDPKTKELLFKTLDDMDSLGVTDSLLQRYFILLDNTSTDLGVKGTVKNIEELYGSVDDFIDKFSNDKNKESRKKEWASLTLNGLPVAKYAFLLDMIKTTGLDLETVNSIIVPEGEVDHDEALHQLVDNYADKRARNEHKHLDYLSSVMFSQDIKEQAREFEMPFKPYMQSAGNSHMDAEGKFTSGRPLPEHSPADLETDNLYDLMKAWQERGGMPVETYLSMTRMFDNTQEITQLNPNRPVDDNEESPMVQAMSIVLSNPIQVENGKAAEMAEKLSELIKVGLNDMVRRLGIQSGMSADEMNEKLINEKQEDVYGLSNIENRTIEAYVKAKIKRSMSSTDDATLLSVIINDDEININVAPGAVTRVVQYVSSFLKKEAVKRKVEAVRLAQMSGNFIQLVELKDTGEVFTMGEAIAHSKHMGMLVTDLFDMSKMRSLKYTTVDQSDKPLTTIQQKHLDFLKAALNENKISKEFHDKSKMQYLSQEGLLTISKGEVVIPATKFEKYFIPKSVGMNSLFRIYMNDKNGNPSDVNFRATGTDVNSIKSTLETIVRDNLVFTAGETKNSKKQKIVVTYSDKIVKGQNKYFDLMFLDGANEHFSKNRKDILKDAYAEFEKLKSKDIIKAWKNGSLSTDESATMTNEFNAVLTLIAQNKIEDFISEQIDTYAKGLSAVNLSIETNIGMRTPSGPGSGFVADVVGFINDNGSVGYVNTIKNMIDGSDQDIDQFTMYYTADTLISMGVHTKESYEQWKKDKMAEGAFDEVAKEEGNVINNELLKMLKEYYMSPDNTNFTMAPIDLDMVKKAAEKAYMSIFPKGDMSYNFGQSMVYRRISMDGQSVGPFALAQKVQTLLYSAYHANGKNGLNTDKFPFRLTKEKYDMVPIWMEMMVNAATDNPKLLALGALNTNLSNADMIASMFFASDEIEAYVNEKMNKEGKPNLNTVEAILYFLKSDAHQQVFDFVNEKANMIDESGGFKPSFFSSASNFYRSLAENYDTNVKNAGDSISSYKTNLGMLRTMLSEFGVLDQNTDEAISLVINGGADPDSLFRDLGRKNIQKMIGDINFKSQQLVLKAIIDAELNGILLREDASGMEDDIKEVINSEKLEASYTMLSMLTDEEKEVVKNARAESVELTKKRSDLLGLIRSIRADYKNAKYLNKRTDKEGFLKEAYLVAKYSMLGSWMGDTIKLANINQFPYKSSYDIAKFEKELKFSTGYTMDKLIGHYDQFRNIKESNPNFTPAEYFYGKPNGMIQGDVLRTKAFETMSHEMAQEDKKWMTQDIEFNGEVINYFEDYHTIGDIAQLLMARPDIMESMRAVRMMRETADKMFLARHADIQKMRLEVLDELGYDLWSEEKDITFFEEVNKFFISDYMRNSGFGRELSDALATFERNEMPLIGGEGTGMLVGMDDPILRRNFIMQFPQFFDDYLRPKLQKQHEDGEITMSDSTIEFLNRINRSAKGTVEWLDVHRSQIMSPDEMEMLREGFNGLPVEMQTLFAAYQMTKDGFDYHRSFFGQVMPVKYLRDYSNYIESNLYDKNIKGRKMANDRYNGLENLKLRILSNVNLNLLRNEKLIKQKVKIGDKIEEKTVGVAPVTANGLARFYAKTIQQQKKSWSKVYLKTRALVETFEITGVALVKGKTSGTNEKVVSFDSIVNFGDRTPVKHTVVLEGKYITVEMSNFAYLRYQIHGHGQAELDKMKAKRAKELGVSVEGLSLEEVTSMAESIYLGDIEKKVYNLRGMPRTSDIETYAVTNKQVQNETIALIKKMMFEKFKNAPEMESALRNLYGKVMVDGYYKSDTSASYIMYAMLNSIGKENFNLQTFMDMNEMPNDEEISVSYNEGPAYRNRNGLLGNYHNVGNPLDQKDVVPLFMADLFKRGRKNNWYQFMYTNHSWNPTMDEKAKDLMASILFKKGLGMSNADASKYENIEWKTTEEQEAIVTAAMNSHYSHLETNITTERINKHAKVLTTIKSKLAQQSGTKEALDYLMSTESIFRLQREYKSTFEVGDVLYFPDGTEGIVIRILDEKTVQYVLNYTSIDTAKVFIPKTSTNKAIMSLEDIVMEGNAHRALEGFVKTISRSLPNVMYRIVDDAEAAKISNDKEHGVSFFQDGIVYINKDRADKAVAVHEFAHPLVLAIRENNKPLYDAMAALVSESSIMDFVVEKYGDNLSGEDLILEAIPTFIQMRYYARMRAEQSPEEQAVWQSFFDEIASMFKTIVTGSPDTASTLDKLNLANATMTNIADALINDMIKGMPMSDITSYELRRMLPYTMKASTSSKLKNLNLTNINQLFQVRADHTDESKTKKLIRGSISSSNTSYQGLSGTYDTSMRNPAFYDKLGKFSDKLRAEYMNNIIEEEYLYYTKMDSKAITFFNSMKTLNPLAAATDGIFASWIKRHDLKNADESVKVALENDLIKQIDLTGFNARTDSAMDLKSAMDYLGIKLPTNVSNENVVVFIHNIGKADQQISIMTVQAESLGSFGGGTKGRLGEAYDNGEMTAAERRNANRMEGVSLTNNNADIEALKNTVLAMAIKNENKAIVIKKVGTIRITGNNIVTQNREVDDMVEQAEILFNKLPQLRESLERDLYDIVTKKELYDKSLYSRPLFEKLESYYRNLLANNLDNASFKKSIEHTLSSIRGITEDFKFSNYEGIQKALRARITHLRIELNDTERLARSEEYQYLLRMYRELTGYNEIGTKRVTSMTIDEKLIGTADRWSGQIRTWAFDQVDLATRKGVEEMLPIQRTLDQWTKKLNTTSGGILQFTGDHAHDLFKPIFKKTKAVDMNGNEVEVSTHEIHWDENDAETASMLRSSQLSWEQLEFGKWLADTMYNEFVEYVMTVERGSIATKVGEDIGTLRESAILEVNRRYKKGMMPVFVRTFGAAVHEGNLREAANLYIKSAGKWYGGNLYEEYQQSDNEYQKEVFRKLLSPFWNQFNSAEMLGSNDRMNLLGLDYDKAGNLTMVNSERQQTLSYNLQNIGDFTMLSSIRTKHLQEAVASVNMAMDMLRGEEVSRGTKTKDQVEHLENYINRQVYGNMPESAVIMINGIAVKVDEALDGTGRFINSIHLAINMKLGLKNAVAAGSKLIINALVNSLAGKDFNLVNVARAASEVFSNPKKIDAINKKYQLVNVSERDIINHWKYVTTKNNVTEPDMQMIMHWFGDYYSQLIGAMAQMMNEGTYDAHDEEGNYDQTKDKRFFSDDGKFITGGESKMRDVVEQQYKEQYHIPVDGKMTHAYSQRDENRVKVIVQRFVGELNDSKFKNMISSFGIARSVMSLKSYVYNVSQAWWKNPSETVHLGERKVKEVNGKEVVYWDAPVTEGMIQTLLYCAKGLGKFVKGDVNDFKNMSQFQKRNLISMATFTGIVAGVYLLADAMLAGEDDDEKEKKKYKYKKDPKTGKNVRVNASEDPSWISTRLLDMIYNTKYVSPEPDERLTYTEELLKYVLLGAVNEQLSYVSPLRPVQDLLLTPNPYIWQAKNVGDLLWNTLTLPYLVGTGQQDAIDAADKWGYHASRNIPFGSIYRNGSEGVKGIIDYLYNDTNE
jgi:hypothetical protein